MYLEKGTTRPGLYIMTEKIESVGRIQDVYRVWTSFRGNVSFFIVEIKCLNQPELEFKKETVPDLVPHPDLLSITL